MASPKAYDDVHIRFLGQVEEVVEQRRIRGFVLHEHVERLILGQVPQRLVPERLIVGQVPQRLAPDRLVVGQVPQRLVPERLILGQVPQRIVPERLIVGQVPA